MSSGNNLAKRRKALRLTQREVANAIGMTDQTISNWERKGTEPRMTVTQIKKLCYILQWTFEELMNEE